MSIKIFGAYRMKTMSLHRFQQWCDRLRVEAQPVAERGFARYCAMTICEKLDNHTLGFEILENPDIYDIMLNTISHAIGDEADSESDWTLRLHAIADSRSIYLMSNYRGRHFSKLLDNQEALTPYNYQNSSDSILDGATPEEWAQRGRTWRRLLKHTSVGECGVEAIIVDKHAYCYPNHHLLKRMLPCLEDRSARATINKEIVATMEEIEHLYPNKPVALYREAKQRVLSLENENELKAKIAANQALLIDVAQALA